MRVCRLRPTNVEPYLDIHTSKSHDAPARGFCARRVSRQRILAWRLLADLSVAFEDATDSDGAGGLDDFHLRTLGRTLPCPVSIDSMCAYLRRETAAAHSHRTEGQSETRRSALQQVPQQLLRPSFVSVQQHPQQVVPNFELKQFFIYGHKVFPANQCCKSA